MPVTRYATDGLSTQPARDMTAAYKLDRGPHKVAVVDQRPSCISKADGTPFAFTRL